MDLGQTCGAVTSQLQILPSNSVLYKGVFMMKGKNIVCDGTSSGRSYGLFVMKKLGPMCDGGDC